MTASQSSRTSSRRSFAIGRLAPLRGRDGAGAPRAAVRIRRTRTILPEGLGKRGEARTRAGLSGRARVYTWEYQSSLQKEMCAAMSPDDIDIPEIPPADGNCDAADAASPADAETPRCSGRAALETGSLEASLSAIASAKTEPRRDGHAHRHRERRGRQRDQALGRGAIVYAKGNASFHQSYASAFIAGNDVSVIQGGPHGRRPDHLVRPGRLLCRGGEQRQREARLRRPASCGQRRHLRGLEGAPDRARRPDPRCRSSRRLRPRGSRHGVQREPRLELATKHHRCRAGHVEASCRTVSSLGTVCLRSPPYGAGAGRLR